MGGQNVFAATSTAAGRALQPSPLSDEPKGHKCLHENLR